MQNLVVETKKTHHKDSQGRWFISIAGMEHAAAVAPAIPKIKMSLTHLHQCMGHMSFSATRAMVAKGIVDGVKISSSLDDVFCETCVKAKITCQSFLN